MATSERENTPYNIELTASQTARIAHVDGLTQESADRTSALLMTNHARYHTFHDAVGFHNHNIHHLLTLYALGATPDEIQAMVDLNKEHQSLVQYRPASVAVKMKDRAFFKQCLGDHTYYDSFLRHFQDEIAERGIPDVVNEILFESGELSDDFLARMHSGFLHPMIHLGYALEFDQPLLIAVALATACVEDNWPGSFFLPAEKLVRENPQGVYKSLVEIMHDLHEDTVIKNATHMSDGLNKITDGLLANALKELIPHLARYRVRPTKEDIEREATEMLHTCAYLIGAAQYPGKVEALDFVMLHTLTLGAFYPIILAQDWITDENKARLLNLKGWSDLVMYAGCGCPALYPERITNYTPKKPSNGWKYLARRACVYEDDGHTCKVVRALLQTYNLPEPGPSFPLKRDDFVKIAHLALDSVERMLEPDQFAVPEHIQKSIVEGLGQTEQVVRTMVRWVRWCGLEGAWDHFPNLVNGS